MGAREFAPEALAALAEPVRDFVFTAADFERVRRLIYAWAGISLNDSKQNMVYSRLARRLRATGIDSFRTYLDRLESDRAFAASERQNFVNALTTNLTAFFREAHHFPVLAEFLRQHASAGELRLWSAAASTGEEPYSIAMTALETLGPNPPVRILATDIDTQVLAQAERGIYRLEALGPCGETRRRRFFLRGVGVNQGLARVRPEVRRLVSFAHLNLLAEDWSALTAFARQVDVVFCRNVMIYFDKDTQRRILQRLAGVLRGGGLLFVGHSENLSDCRALFVARGNTVYERVAA
ncbi:MAG: CheR family methyltransferase [Sutterellaceae bacterium]|nr:chemotaxis protein CheR [Burkholderiaceae bacterium]MCX7900962.1 chemotaxis protein CheR [Burkholderiaceae bacterium]MDW8429996.1 CheR family methyltransferase [Sutterellaceae bacterium]